ncbi:MAG: uncharacterized protein KVP18_001498 [Porospora cf. gigantea A]|uniref:uncharacterized protein n=1 Tax=Porospora cf. gigantea A TaxID=2853593 RepID=UPI00355A85E6|nr:MAG: hypothetical protein KVP18_001498 [Porospora cf. gigantea A]
MPVLVCGTYDGGIVGFNLDLRLESQAPPAKKAKTDTEDRDEAADISVSQVFAYTPHMSCVKSLRAAGSFLISTSSDQTVRVYDINSCKEKMVLTDHASTVTCSDVVFGSNGKPSHILTGDEEGDLILWQWKNFQVLHKLRGTGRGIEGCAVHPSGSICVAVGREQKVVAVFDLRKGSLASKKKFKTAPFACEWSPDGRTYGILFHDQCLLSVDGQEHCVSMKRVTSMLLLDETAMFGTQDGVMFVYRFGADSVQLVSTVKAASGSRIKGIALLDATELVIGATTSKGELLLWVAEDTAEDTFDVLTEKDMRVTCFACTA